MTCFDRSQRRFDVHTRPRPRVSAARASRLGSASRINCILYVLAYSCDYFLESDWRALQAARATRALYTFVQTPSSLFAKGAGHETKVRVHTQKTYLYCSPSKIFTGLRRSDGEVSSITIGFVRDSGVARAIEPIGHRCACAKALTTPTN